MTKTIIISAGLLLASCGHMPKTDIKSTENDQYSIASPTAPEFEMVMDRNAN